INQILSKKEKKKITLRKYLKIALKDGFISILDLQLAGKKRITVAEFLRGFPINNEWKIE
ncbi:MAG: hypothetical protein NTX97_08275, partial [Bacteroidetes bacterium]|nr:hypothetical protein [Bacteroidota bacterium]